MKKITTLLICLMAFSQALAQTDNDEIAKKLANPVAAMVQLPIQSNLDYGIGTTKGSRYKIFVQPVIPFEISPKLNLITRVILPFVEQYNIGAYGTHQSGLSDITASAFFTPRGNEKGFTWGVGPAFLVPIGPSNLSTEKWGVGPTVIALKQQNGWTVGMLANQIWSVAGNSSRGDVSQMLVNPFVSHNWKKGATVNLGVEWSQNWITNTGTVFVYPGISGITSIGKQRINLAIAPRISLYAPANAKSDFGLRASISFVFPK